MLGAGVSKPLGFPDWEDLIERIAAVSEIDGIGIVKSPKKRDPQSSRTQMLYQRFKRRRYDGEDSTRHHTAELDLAIRREWREIVQRCLYQDIDTTSKVSEKHPYLRDFVRVITHSALTVNYNFDDSIERLLDQEAAAADDNKRRYETIWDAGTQLSTDRTAIYHPNGFLPSNLLENPSEHLVFAEDAFADQLIASMAGHYSSLLHHLFKNTCLFLGISLDDSTLKHLLRQNARINPGHYHYYVAFVADAEGVDPDRAAAIRAANFDCLQFDHAVSERQRDRRAWLLVDRRRYRVQERL